MSRASLPGFLTAFIVPVCTPTVPHVVAQSNSQTDPGEQAIRKGAHHSVRVLEIDSKLGVILKDAILLASCEQFCMPAELCGAALGGSSANPLTAHARDRGAPAACLPMSVNVGTFISFYCYRRPRVWFKVWVLRITVRTTMMLHETNSFSTSAYVGKSCSCGYSGDSTWSVLLSVQVRSNVPETIARRPP